MPYKPHIAITNHIQRGTLPLFENLLYAKNGSSYADTEFSRCKEMFKDKLPDEYCLGENGLLTRSANIFQNAYIIITQLEKKFKTELQQLGIDIIREIYDVPNHVALQASLKSGVDDISFDGKDEDVKDLDITKERLQYREKEIQKRIILNGLVHGSSMHIWKSCHYIVKDKLDKLDDRLMDVYNRYITIVSFQLWKNEPMLHSTAQGFNKIEFEKQNSPSASIEIEAINFPVLLHETNKGVMDYLICRAIPKDFTEQELKYYYAKADKYEDEIWHYLLSPSLWKDLLDAITVPTQNIPDIIAKLSLLEYEELVEIFDVLHNEKNKSNLILKKYEIK